MDLVLNNGDKLYRKEGNKHTQAIKCLEKSFGIELFDFQKEMLKQIFKQDKEEVNVYGDDFKVEIIHTNRFNHDCALVIKDYNENQEFENKTSIAFTKDELSQFINLLKVAKSKME